MKNTTKMIAALVLVLIVVIFSVMNGQSTEVNFIFTKVELPLSVILIVSILVGAVIAFIALLGNTWQKNKTIKQLNKTIQETQTIGNNETNEEIDKLKEELKEKDLELSDLRHKAVNQIISKDEEQISN